MINWNKVIQQSGHRVLESFALGNMAKNDFLHTVAYTEQSGQIRNAIRSRGTSRVRKASRQALQRRNLI